MPNLDRFSVGFPDPQQKEAKVILCSCGCEAATPGPWEQRNLYVTAKMGANEVAISICYAPSVAQFIAEAREGWPHAIRRALEMEDKCRQLAFELEKAEREIDRLQNELGIYQEQLEQRCART